MPRQPIAPGPLGLAAVFLLSACSMATPEKYALIGAASGTLVGAGIGCAVAGGVDRDDPTTYVIGCGSGAAAGAMLGGTIGYLAAKRFAPKPPPPPKVAQIPPPLPPPPPAPPPAVKERLVLRGVHFDFDKSEIRREDRPVLDEAAETLRANPKLTVNVDGYCDAMGSEEYNLKLSERRADAVASYLEGEGIGANHLIPHGFGKTHFVAPNDTDEGRAQNRRVELVPVE